MPLQKHKNEILYNAICYMVEQGMNAEQIERYLGVTKEEIFEQCGFDLNEGKSFLDDTEKMIDFFSLNKKEFLDSYSYLRKADYDATCKEIFRINSKYEGCWELDGREIRDILLGLMLKEWLESK